MKIGQHAEKPVPATSGNSATAPTTAATASTAANAAAAPTTTAIPATADPSARIQLSNTASTLLTSQSTPEFDAEKVARISKAIEDGSFKINPGAIADKLISNAKEVLGKIQS